MKTIRLIIFLTIALFTHVAHAQTNEIDKAKADIAELIKETVKIYKCQPNTNNYIYVADAKKSEVFEDRIEFRCINGENIKVYFNDIMDYQILIGHDETNKFDRVFFGNLEIVLSGGHNWFSGAPEYNGESKQFFNDLIIIQNHLVGKRNEQLSLFVPVAEKYRSLEVKPPITEEQREYIVQANSFNEEKNYPKAIELYKKVIETDQTSYPAAYSNLALLSAQLHGYNAAVFYMKIYLLLEPDAADARSAKDKIYEWKARIAQ